MNHAKQDRLPFTIDYSSDWAPPIGFKKTMGVLVARLGKGDFGLFKYGTWRRMSRAEWQSQYATMFRKRPVNHRSVVWKVESQA